MYKRSSSPSIIQRASCLYEDGAVVDRSLIISNILNASSFITCLGACFVSRSYNSPSTALVGRLIIGDTFLRGGEKKGGNGRQTPRSHHQRTEKNKGTLFGKGQLAHRPPPSPLPKKRTRILYCCWVAF